VLPPKRTLIANLSTAQEQSLREFELAFVRFGTGSGFDQPAHLVIEARYDGVHIAKLATDQAKRCGDAFDFGRHGNSLGDSAAFEVVGMPCSGCVAVSYSAALIASIANPTPVLRRCNA
jgi:hypothetical protein